MTKKNINIHHAFAAPMCNSGWIYTFGTASRAIRMDGNDYQVVAWDLKHAIKQVRKFVSRGFSLRLISTKRCD